MPYSKKRIGIYRILNTENGKCYVGQSRNLYKRMSEHKRLLCLGKHPNQKLQHAYKKYGEASFKFSIEIECEDPSDLDSIEMMFISGEARFDDDTASYNICRQTTSGMAGRKHSEATRIKIAANRKPVADVARWRKHLIDGAIRSAMTDPHRRKQIEAVIYLTEMRNCDLARLIGKDPSTCLRMTKRYRNLYQKGILNEYLF